MGRKRKDYIGGLTLSDLEAIATRCEHAAKAIRELQGLSGATGSASSRRFPEPVPGSQPRVGTGNHPPQEQPQLLIQTPEREEYERDRQAKIDAALKERQAREAKKSEAQKERERERAEYLEGMKAERQLKMAQFEAPSNGVATEPA